MVDMEIPSAYVQFLRSMMPRKPRNDLYSALGLAQQRKTLLYLPSFPCDRHKRCQARPLQKSKRKPDV